MAILYSIFSAQQITKYLKMLPCLENAKTNI